MVLKLRVKLTKFTFEPTEDKDHWVTFCKFGECTSSHTEIFDSEDDVPLLFKDSSEDTFQISFDQSTTDTGMFVKNYDNTKAFMMELRRDSDAEDASRYIFNLEMFLHRQFEGVLVSHVIYEKPITSGSYQSSRVLFQLEGMLTQLSMRYAEFRNARLDNITNSSWRRVVIMSAYSEYSRKVASKQSILSIFPWTMDYGNSMGADNDIYEAMGIMFGWFINSFDELGRPYVRGDRYTGAIGGFILPGAGAEDVSEQFKGMGLDSFYMVENPRKSIFENLVSAVQKYKIVCVELNTKSAMLAMSIECGFKWLDPDVMTVVLVAANHVDRRLFKITGEEYHFVV